MLVWTIVGAVAAVLAAFFALLGYLRAHARRRRRDERDVKAYGVLEGALRMALVFTQTVLEARTDSWSVTVSKFRSSLVRVQAAFVELAEDFRPRRVGRLIRKMELIPDWVRRLDSSNDDVESVQGVAEEVLPRLRAAHKLARRRAK